MSQPLIAVVDDDQTLLEMIAAILTDEGYRVLLWSEGKTAYEQVRDHAPDLLILDLHMEHPRAGWIVVHMLRVDHQTAHIPVLICTGDAEYVRAREQALREKRCDVLLKPFSADDLVRHVRRLLAAEPVEPAPAPDTPPPGRLRSLFRRPRRS